MLGTINPGLAARLNLDNIQTSYIVLSQGVGLVPVLLVCSVVMVGVYLLLRARLSAAQA